MFDRNLTASPARSLPLATAATIPTLEGTPRTEAERCLASPPVFKLKCAERQGAFYPVQQFEMRALKRWLQRDP